MERAGAPKGDEREFAGVMPALDRDDAERIRHIAVDDRDYAGSRFLDRLIERAGQLRLEGGYCGGVVDRHTSTEKRACVKIAQDEIGVGHCWALAATSVADGSGFCTRTARADTQSPSRVDPGNAAAPGTHFG